MGEKKGGKEVSFLERAAALARRQVAESREAVPAPELERACSALPPPPSLRNALRRPPGEEVRIMAEVKRRSPSRGDIRPALSVAETVRAYGRGGASAVSVLTEPHFFGGSLDDLREAAAHCGLPLLRKDFIVHPYQILESRAAGAAAVLLIVSLLEGKTLSRLMAEASGMGLECLVEVHDEGELERALEAEAEVIGINNRDLATLAVDKGTVLRLASLVPPSRVLVGESGYRSRGDIVEAGRAGVHAVLVGEVLSAAEDPEEALRSLRGEGDGLP